MGTAHRPRQPLTDLRVMVVEDEALLFVAMEDVLLKLGCREISHAKRVSEAIDLLKSGGSPDLALLDVNLGGELVFPVAEKLVAAGVPFIFTTGYDPRSLPQEWIRWPIIQKPFTQFALNEAITAMMTASERQSAPNSNDDQRSLQ